MSEFDTTSLPDNWDELAPDGSRVRKLLRVESGDMAHFELPAGEVSTAEVHPGFEEMWYFVGGSGEMWRKQGDREELVKVAAGVSISIPRNTIFQFRSFGDVSLEAIGVTMPPWSGESSVENVEGIWKPTVGKLSDPQ